VPRASLSIALAAALVLGAGCQFPRETLEGIAGRPAVVDEWLLDDLELVSAKTLLSERHVMLTAPGENALLVELERFLLDRKARARELLDEEGRP
jgi:hypothetical protein